MINILKKNYDIECEEKFFTFYFESDPISNENEVELACILKIKMSNPIFTYDNCIIEAINAFRSLKYED